MHKAYELTKYLNHNSNSYSSKENKNLAQAIELNSEVNIRDREIDYLKLQNQLKEERIRRELLLRDGLRRENQLKDYTLKQEHQLHGSRNSGASVTKSATSTRKGIESISGS